MNKKQLRSILRSIPAVMMCGCGIFLTACFDDSDSVEANYAEWRDRNLQYLADAEAMTDTNGNPYYTRIVPSWAPNAYVLVHWHNERELTKDNLSPLDNSTVAITYALSNVDGTRLADSFSNTDSLYTSRPSTNIIGVWTALTHMNVGDSVTMVIPSQAGYGEMVHGDIAPYSTLIYDIKLKKIVAYEVP